jgi:hypothetical protein
MSIVPEIRDGFYTNVCFFYDVSIGAMRKRDVSRGLYDGK